MNHHCPPTPPRPSAEALYRSLIFPGAMDQAARRDDGALAAACQTRGDVARRIAHVQCLALAEYAADQHDDESGPVIHALIDATRAKALLLEGPCHDEALDAAEAATQALRESVELLIDHWGLEP